MFLFVVVGFMPRTSCILILLFIVVCRGRGSFVSMWVVDRCASPQMLEVSFQPAFPTSMDRIMLLCVFHFRVRASCSRHGVCPCVSICWRLEETLCLNSFAVFPEHMVFMFSSGVDDNSSHSAKRACCGTKLKSMRRTLWQSGKSWHLCRRRWPFIFRFPS